MPGQGMTRALGLLPKVAWHRKPLAGGCLDVSEMLVVGLWSEGGVLDLRWTSDKYGKTLKICLLTSSGHKAHWWKGCIEIVMAVLDHSPDFPHLLTLRLLWSARWP